MMDADLGEDADDRPRFRPLGFAAALRFLTLLPFPGVSRVVLSRALLWFPVVGLVIGALQAALGAGATWLLGDAARAWAIVAGGALLTAGLHLDGLADSADALLSWRDRDRKLEILRDPHTGALGAAALVLLLSGKVLALRDLEAWLPATLLAPVWGRWAAVHGMARFATARSDGLGATARDSLRRWHLPAVTVLALVPGLLMAPIPSIAIFASVLLMAEILGRLACRSLGGLTGDLYGALCELGELTVLLTCLALERHGWLAETVVR